MHIQVLGMHGKATFEQMVNHFTSMGGDCVIMDPNMIMGADHAMSAAMHAERSFSEGTNRSKTVLTETILYCAWERQIGKALQKMRPKEGCTDYVVVLFDIDDPHIEEIGMVRNDSILEPSRRKAELLGITEGSTPLVDQAIENVAMVELLKN